MPPAHPFCPGYTGAFRTLAENYPGTLVYPSVSFRTEWGPIFHRGRLNGTARLLVIGQDPAEHENVCRRILVGKAGQRVQGFLARLGVGDHYVMINTFVYSLYASVPSAQVVEPNLSAYRHSWLEALIKPGTKIKAVVALGNMADQAWHHWRTTTTAGGAATAAALAYVKITHPTADAHPPITQTQILQNWNLGLQVVAPALQAHPAPYGTVFGPGDLAPIPEEDLPAGVPAWMRALDPWAARVNHALLATVPPLSIATAPVPPDSSDRYTRRHLALEVPATEVP
jgi:uracil-DNA glycosylase